MNAIRICIDQYENDMQGRIYSRMKKEVLLFKNCSEMLLRSDRLFDECGYPQAFQEKRSFGKSEIRQGRYKAPEAVLDEDEILGQYGRCRTFDIVVQSRRRAGWQGRVLSQNGEYLFEYRSEMELLEGISGELGTDVCETEPICETDDLSGENLKKGERRL